MESKPGSKAIVDFFKERDEEEVKAFRKENQFLLSKFGISMNKFSPQADKSLTKLATYQKILNTKKLDDASLHIWYYEAKTEEMKNQLYNLELQQSIRSREQQNQQEETELERFREELSIAKKNVKKHPDVKKELDALHIRLASYKKNETDAKAKLAKLDIKPEIRPESLLEKIVVLNTSLAERDRVKIKADNISMVRTAKKDLLKLKVSTKQ